MSETMDPKTIATVDQLVNGYAKAKSLYQENKAMISKLNLWFQKNKTKIIIGVIILVGVVFYVYRQYQVFKEEPVSTAKKTTAVKEKVTLEKQKAAENTAIPL
jgi:predicted negative regulator of RcsB-dependent stress response